jgi:3-hydroxyisobutyrate dehydrogenase-like beta-hydroxyacid dehydrogenase
VTPREAVGFIGLGQIGRPMAMRLVDWPGGLWVCDVDADATAALEQAGAKVAATPRELAEQAGVICVMVRDDDQVRDVLHGVLAGAQPGTVVVVHSTVHPDTPVQLADLAASQGVHVLDAPVSGGAIGAHQGTLALLVGGDDDAFVAAQPVLEAMGGLVTRFGPIGAGTRAKLARNMLHFISFTAVTEANRLAAAAGIDLIELGKVVRHTDAITGGAGAIMHRPTTALLRADDPWFAILGHVRALGEKDLGFAIELARDLDVEVPLACLALDRLGPGLGFAERDAAPETERP